MLFGKRGEREIKDTKTQYKMLFFLNGAGKRKGGGRVREDFKMLPLHSDKSGLLLLSVLTMSTSCNPARGRFKIFTHLVLYLSD